MTVVYLMVDQFDFTNVHSSCYVLVLQGAFKVEYPNEVKVSWVGSLCYLLCDHLQKEVSKYKCRFIF